MPPPHPASDPSDDPVIARRRSIGRLADAGQRIGYLLFGLAVVLFAVGIATDFPTPVTTGVTAALGLGSVVLAPSIVAGYAVRAADREEREDQGRRPG